MVSNIRDQLVFPKPDQNAPGLTGSGHDSGRVMKLVTNNEARRHSRSGTRHWFFCTPHLGTQFSSGLI